MLFMNNFANKRLSRLVISRPSLKVIHNFLKGTYNDCVLVVLLLIKLFLHKDRIGFIVHLIFRLFNLIISLEGIFRKRFFGSQTISLLLFVTVYLSLI